MSAKISVFIKIYKYPNDFFECDNLHLSDRRAERRKGRRGSGLKAQQANSIGHRPMCIVVGYFAL